MLTQPDVRSAAFAAEARRPSLLLAEADRSGDDQDVVDASTLRLDDAE